MPDARSAILANLRGAPGPGPAPDLDFSVLEAKRWSPEERLGRLRQGMAAVKTEFLTPLRHFEGVVQPVAKRRENDAELHVPR